MPIKDAYTLPQGHTYYSSRKFFWGLTVMWIFLAADVAVRFWRLPAGSGSRFDLGFILLSIVCAWFCHFWHQRAIGRLSGQIEEKTMEQLSMPMMAAGLFCFLALTSAIGLMHH